jgi:aspartyl-tRNA(Asn)/glutamyl-tRNA(Gln) amidotransferase subunit A
VVSQIRALTFDPWIIASAQRQRRSHPDGQQGRAQSVLWYCYLQTLPRNAGSIGGIMAAESHIEVTRRSFIADVTSVGAAAAAVVASAPSASGAQITAPATFSRRNARDRLEAALARIADRNGEGARACLTVYAEPARAAADAADTRARDGITLGPLDGAIVTIKDLFDVAGEPTRAGSTVLANAPPAKTDATVVHRLRAAGAVIVAKTNMVEFAFGAGLNRHYGTAGNPADRTRIPGGSSSGAAVAVADGMCEIGIGTDTAGSVRIPAALCGVVGFKPSKFRVPTDGAFPLSYTLDSVGPLARTVVDCANADAVMADDAPWSVETAPLSGLRLGIPQGRPLANLDATVTARFSAATDQLRRAGVRLSDETIPLIDDMARVNGPFVVALSAVEGYSIHRQRLATRGAEYDAAVRARLEAARGVSAADYIDIVRQRNALVRAMDTRLSDLDALVLPTTPIVAPPIAELVDDAKEGATNGLARNTVIVNFFDLCAISLPCPRAGGLPVGLMLVARNGQDRKLLRMAAAVERMFAA